MPEHLARPVPDEGDGGLRARHLLDHLGDLQDADRPGGAQVDHLALHRLHRDVEQPVQGLAVVLDIQPVALGAAVPVDGQGLAQEGGGDEPGDHLLEVLVGPVVVEGPHDDHGKLVGGPVAIDQAVGPGLGAGVGAHGHERLLLVHQVRPGGAVDLGGGDVDHPLDPILVLQDGVGHDLGAHHVGLEEDPVVVDRPGHVALGREVDHRVALADQGVHELAIADVAVPEAQAALAVVARLHVLLGKVLHVARVREHVEHHDLVIGVLLEDVADEVAANETGAAGDQDRLGHRTGGPP